MGKKAVSWAVSLTLGVGLWAYPGSSHAAEQSVRVALPDFKVTLNGNVVENRYREYPLLTYKDITYFPMTWYDCRLLGLETAWSQKDGLSIAQGKVASSYYPYRTDRVNARSFQATVQQSLITVNGKTVDNAKEEYPLLSYRDIVYFPLTWKFAHDEFGWQYEWDAANGLAVTSGDPQIRTLSLPAAAGENGVAAYKGYVYFTETEGTTNTIYRAPLGDPASKEKVYEYELDTTYGLQKYLSFEVRDGGLWFFYHRGGATMGTNVYGKITDDGKAEVVHQGYLDFRQTAYGTLIVDLSVPPRGNNLRLVPPGSQDRQGAAVGDPNLIYARHVTTDANGTGYTGGGVTTVIGDDAYVIASPYPVAAGSRELNRLYKVNLKTGETDVVINESLRQVAVRDNKLYYVKDADQLLYAANLDGTGERKLSDNEVSGWFDVVDGNAYYTTGSSEWQGPYHLFKADPATEDSLVIQDAVESVELANGNIVVKLAAGGDYGMKILDRSGALNVAIADQVSNVFVHDGSIVFVSAEDRSVKLVAP